MDLLGPLVLEQVMFLHKVLAQLLVWQEIAEGEVPSTILYCML